MPIHDWTRVYPGVFHDFHQSWTVRIKDTLNAGLLPSGYYALVEQRSLIGTYADRANRVVVQRPLARTVACVELVSPGIREDRHSLSAFVERCIHSIQDGIHLVLVDLFPPSRHDPFGLHQAIWSRIHPEEIEWPVNKDRAIVSYQATEDCAAYVEPLAVGDVLSEVPLFLNDNCYASLSLELPYMATLESLTLEMRQYVETGLLKEQGDANA